MRAASGFFSSRMELLAFARGLFAPEIWDYLLHLSLHSHSSLSVVSERPEPPATRSAVYMPFLLYFYPSVVLSSSLAGPAVLTWSQTGAFPCPPLFKHAFTLHIAQKGLALTHTQSITLLVSRTFRDDAKHMKYGTFFRIFGNPPGSAPRLSYIINSIIVFEVTH